MKGDNRPARFFPKLEGQLQAIHINPIESLSRPIRIVDYDPLWPKLFEREAEKIRTALSNQALMIEHVGSTAVPGLAAKPVIDIVLVISDSANEPSYTPALETAGYVLQLREPSWYQHRLFKGSDPDVNLHVFSEGCPEIDRMLVFRDWLRSNEDDRRLYERTKRELAGRQWKYVQQYADAKTMVVEQILARAHRAEKSAAHDLGFEL